MTFPRAPLPGTSGETVPISTEPDSGREGSCERYQHPLEMHHRTSLLLILGGAALVQDMKGYSLICRCFTLAPHTNLPTHPTCTPNLCALSTPQPTPHAHPSPSSNTSQPASHAIPPCNPTPQFLCTQSPHSSPLEFQLPCTLQPPPSSLCTPLQPAHSYPDSWQNCPMLLLRPPSL